MNVSHLGYKKVDDSFIATAMELLSFPESKKQPAGLYNYRRNSSASMVFTSAIRQLRMFEILLVFNQPTKVSVDYGDGTIVKLEGLSITTPAHDYAEPNIISVKLDFEIPANLTSFSVTNWGVSFGQSFPMKFSWFPNLKTLTFNNTYFNKFDDSVLFSAINRLTLVGGPGSTSPSELSPPLELTRNMKLDYLNLGNYNLDNPDMNGLSELFEQQPALNNLQLFYTRIGPSSISQSMSRLEKLATLNITETTANSPNCFQALPFVISQLKALSSLTLRSFAVVDISGLFSEQSLVKATLNSLTISGCTALPSNLGDGFFQMEKLKTIVFDSLTYSETVAGITRNYVDNFIDFIYGQVSGHAPMTGTSASLLRSMTVSISRSSQPLGEYRSPSGYIAGASNGSPASSLEKIWVMVNQYAHNWLYTINYISVSISKVVGNVAVTVVCATKHNLRAGASIRISGADQAGYNGTFSVASIVDDYTLKFNLASGVEPGTATGTILLSSNL